MTDNKGYPDKPLGEQKRPLDESLSAFAVARDYFTPDAPEVAAEPVASEQLHDDLNDILSPFHWEAWKAALFSDHRDGWPDDDEQEDIVRRVDDMAVGEHYHAWADEVRDKIAALILAHAPQPDALAKGAVIGIEPPSEFEDMIHEMMDLQDRQMDALQDAKPALAGENERLRAALVEIAELSRRKQLPITSAINDVASAALAVPTGREGV